MRSDGAELLSVRISNAYEYLQFLSRCSGLQAWRDGYRRFRLGECPIPEALSLVHPVHLKRAWVEDLDFVKGERSFTGSAEPWSTCQADLIWGYDCPFEEEELESDHLFPFSAGGPTDAENRLWLCATHNGFKSSDIHLFPWEVGLPQWVAPRLAAMAARIG